MERDSPQPGRSNYLDFELEIDEGRGREYPVAVLRSPAGDARATMHFPFDELALDLRLTKLQNALLRSGGVHRRVPSEEEQAVQEFGQALFDALLDDDIRTCYDLSLREAARQDRGLRLKLRIRPPELSALPWEFLYDPRQAEYVCLSRRTPIVRYLESLQPVQPFTVTPPLRVLGMVASPVDLPTLDVERERQRVEQAVQDLRERGLVELEWLPGQTWRDLQEATWGGPWHVFHFIGHGGFDANADEGFIALADRAGGTHRLSATLLGRLLADHAALRLVLLNSCEGARGGARDIFSSTASILVRRGIPAVLAMQYEITDRAAVELAQAFYRALAYGMAVDEAVVAARKAISLAVTNTVEWGTPVLYTRAAEGVLFQIGGRPPVEPLPPGVPERLPEVDPERERRLERLYLDGLDATWLEEWDRAARSFRAVIAEQPGYQDAATRLQAAERRQEQVRLYEQGLAAREEGDWPSALAFLERLVAEAPDYEGAADLLETAREQVELADLYAQAQKLHRAGRWQAVVNVFAQIAALEPDYADLDGLLPEARRELEAERRQGEVGDLYRRAGQAVDAEQWAEARRLLRQVQEREPGYRETERLLAKVEAEIEREELEQVERKRQEQIASLYEDTQGLARRGQWRQALAKLEQVRNLDPQFSDPRGIAARARAEVAREEKGARRTPLPAWFWPAAGGAAVLVIVAIIVIGGALGGGDGAETAVPRPTWTAVAGRTTPSPSPSVQIPNPTATKAEAAPTEVEAVPTEAPLAAGLACDEPIKIGVITDLTGPLALYGIMIERSFLLGMEYTAGAPGTGDNIFQVDDCEIQVLLRDDQSNPETTVTVARELIEVENVDILVGTVSSGATVALQEVAGDSETVLIVAPAAANDITGVGFSEYTFRTSRENYQDSINLCEYLAEQYDTFVQIAPDYSFGYGGAQASRDACTFSGGKFVADDIFAPLDAVDFTPYLTRIIDSGADAWLITWVGGGYVPMFEAAQELGVLDSMALGVTYFDNLTMPSVFQRVVGQTGGILYCHQCPDNEINDWLVQESEARHGVPPDLFYADGMNAAILALTALKATEGDTSSAALIAAMEGMAFEGPKGTIFIRPEDHVAIQDMYIVKLLNLDDPDANFYEIIDTTRPEPPCLLPEDKVDRCGDLPIGRLTGQ
jgi:ABC-type branched-subunit amino acid transport system substrate-binding protein/CHAT domain-containing protein